MTQAGILYVAHGKPIRFSPPTNFETLENISIAGSGSFLVDRATGVPESFAVPAISAQTTEKWYQFTTLGDGNHNNILRVASANSGFLDGIKLDLVDASGYVVQKNAEAITLRAVPAGKYFLRVHIASGFTTPFTLEITPPVRGQSHETSTHPDRDILIGNDGNDKLVGNDDFDKLFGGTGADQFTGEPIEIHDRDFLDLPNLSVSSSQTTFGNVPKFLDPVIGFTTTTVFEENFDSGTTFNGTRWQLVTNATIDTVGINEPSGTNSARLNGNRQRTMRLLRYKSI